MSTAPPRRSVFTSRLPSSPSSLIGRDRELALLREFLASHRLVTLTGAGGSGKTRLALETVRSLEQENAFPDGIAWVELASLQDGSLVSRQILSLLGLREEAARSPAETLLQRLEDRTLLLALDNCEHVVDACAELVGSLLSYCPNLRVLATSREALPEGDLSADPQALLVSEAGRLFVERAGAVNSGFQLDAGSAVAMASICRQLDGIPLAIALAAGPGQRADTGSDLGPFDPLLLPVDFRKTGTSTSP